MKLALKRLRKKALNKYLYKLIQVYPPYLGAGVKVKELDKKGLSLEISMKLSLLNANYVGTHFGGSLYSMCDPFYMLILLQQIGKDYVVWDKSASIDFKKPGKGRVKAIVEISQEEIENIKSKVAELGVYQPVYTLDILNEQNEVVATVEKKLWIKKKTTQ